MIWTSAFMRPGLYLIHSSFQGLTWKSRMFTIVHFPWSLLTTDFAPASKDVLSFSVSEPPLYLVTTGFSGGASGKEPACQCRRHKRHGFDPWVGNISWRKACSPVQYSCLENPMDRGAWWATVLGVAKSQTWLTTHAHTLNEEKETSILPNIEHLMLFKALIHLSITWLL